MLLRMRVISFDKDVVSLHKVSRQPQIYFKFAEGRDEATTQVQRCTLEGSVVAHTNDKDILECLVWVDLTVRGRGNAAGKHIPGMRCNESEDATEPL
jgi:hypothetical protein